MPKSIVLRKVLICGSFRGLTAYLVLAGLLSVLLVESLAAQAATPAVTSDLPADSLLPGDSVQTVAVEPESSGGVPIFLTFGAGSPEEFRDTADVIRTEFVRDVSRIAEECKARGILLVIANQQRNSQSFVSRAPVERFGGKGTYRLRVSREGIRHLIRPAVRRLPTASAWSLISVRSGLFVSI